MAKTLDGSTGWVCTRENAQVVRGSSTGPGDESGFAFYHVGRRVDGEGGLGKGTSDEEDNDGERGLDHGHDCRQAPVGKKEEAGRGELIRNLFMSPPQI